MPPRATVPAALIDLLDGGERRLRIGQRSGRSLTGTDALQQVQVLRPPGRIGTGILVNGRVGRTHLRQHPVEREPLDTVAAAEAVDVELAVAAEDLEREQVLPLGAAGVQPG